MFWLQFWITHFYWILWRLAVCSILLACFYIVAEQRPDLLIFATMTCSMLMQLFLVNIQLELNRQVEKYTLWFRSLGQYESFYQWQFVLPVLLLCFAMLALWLVFDKALLIATSSFAGVILLSVAHKKPARFCAGLVCFVCAYVVVVTLIRNATIRST